MKFVKAIPPGVDDGDKVIWDNIGNLGPGESIPLNITFRGIKDGEGTYTTTVTCNEGAKDEAECSVKVFSEDFVDLEVACEPDEATIPWLGTTTITLTVVVIKESTIPANNVVLQLELPEGLEFVSAQPKETSSSPPLVNNTATLFYEDFFITDFQAQTTITK